MSSAPIVHLEFRSFDFARASAFYAKVFAWRTEQNATSTYMKLDAEDGPSAGWVRAEVSQAPGPLAYIAVEDLAATLAEVESAGGRILVPKLPFAGGGEIALFADPDGNVVAIWMRKDHGGKPALAAPAAPPAGKVAAAKPAAPAAKAAAKPAAKAKTPKKK
jgi:predicted enzyme related to lactoylglutathione lyase